MSQINSNTKDDFQVVLLLSCFVGHPVFAHLSKKCSDLCTSMMTSTQVSTLYPRSSEARLFWANLIENCTDLHILLRSTLQIHCLFYSMTSVCLVKEHTLNTLHNPDIFRNLFYSKSDLAAFLKILRPNLKNLIKHCLNLETLNTNLSGTNRVWAESKC